MRGFHHSSSDTSAERNYATTLIGFVCSPWRPQTRTLERHREHFLFMSWSPATVCFEPDRSPSGLPIVALSFGVLNLFWKGSWEFCCEKNWKNFDSSVVGFDAFSFGLLNCSGREGKLDLHRGFYFEENCGDYGLSRCFLVKSCRTNMFILSLV